MRQITKVCLFLGIFFLLPLIAVNAQTIRGKVVDKESKTPLFGVIVQLQDSALGASTDTNGAFVIHGVPLGKHTLVISYIGYLSTSVPNLLITSAKEVITNIELEQSAKQLGEVAVTGTREHINEMAVVSAKTFDVDEVERYAGSRADIPRMASNFAGVQGNDDSRNDIVIRGNSPTGG